MTVIRKLLIPTLVIFAVGLFTISGLGLYQISQSVQQQEEADLSRLDQLFQNRLSELESFALALATLVASNPEVQAAFAAGNRDRLTELTLPAYLRLDEQFDVPQFQFHQPPAISYLRLHQPELFGEDLSLYRPSVVMANAEQRYVSGPEIGRSGLGVRGVVPVSYLDEHIGTVEFGINVDQTLLEEMKAQVGGDWQILLNRDAARFAILEGAAGKATGPTADLLLQASTLEQPFFADEATYRQVLDGDFMITHRNLAGQQFTLFSYPLRDFSGNVVGVVEVVTDRTPVVVERNLGLMLSAAISFLALIIGGGILVIIATRTLRPVGDLTEAVTAIAGGDLDRAIPVPTRGEDEIAKLARAFGSMTGQLRSLIGSLEERVTDRTQRLETVTVISERLNAILNVDELLAEVVNQTQQNFGYYHAHIYLLDEPNDNLVVAAGTGPAGAEMIARGHSIAVSARRSLVAQAARTGETVNVENVRVEAGWLPNTLLPNTYAEMAVPITLEGKVVGVLDVQQDEVAGLDESDASLLRSLANQVAVAIRNARLFAEVETALAEAQAAQQRYAEQAWTSVASTQRGAEYHYQRPGARVLDETVVNKLEHEILSQNQAPVKQNEDPEQHLSSLATSIKYQDQTIGVIQLHDTEHQRQWSELDLALVQAVAGQVAQTAENLRLFEETRERASRERLIGQVGDRLRRAPDMEALMQTAVGELARILGPDRAFVRLGSEAELGGAPQNGGVNHGELPELNEEAEIPGPEEPTGLTSPANGREPNVERMSDDDDHRH